MVEWNGMRLSPKCPDTLSFKGKKPKKCAGKRKGTKETEVDWGQGDARPCVLGSMAVPPPPRATRGDRWSLRFRCFSNAAFCALFGPWIFALDHPTWAHWASFC